MKKTLLLLILFCISLNILSATKTIKVSGIWYIIDIDNHTAEVTYCREGDYSGNIKIAEVVEYEGESYTVTSIGGGAFSEERGVYSISIPNSVTAIGGSAFYGCENLSTVNIPTNLETIGSHAFYQCYMIKAIELPQSVTQIGDYAFAVCIRLESINIPETIDYLPDALFQSCEKLTNIELHNGITSIGSSVFNGCHKLVDFTIPSNVTSIGDNAFFYCNSLSSVTIPSSVTSIGAKAFGKCPKLSTVYCYAKDVPQTDLSVFEESQIKYASLYVPTNSLSAYSNVSPWKDFGTKVGMIVTYKLTYIVDEEIYKTEDIDYGSTITPEPAPAKEGYTFSGWSEIPETIPSHDVTVTGSFTVNKYKLTYMVDGEEYKTSEVEYDTTISPESEPAKEGYTFSGWSEIPETMPSHDVTVTGSFTVNKYKLTYMVDGEEYKTTEVEYDTTISPESEPAKEGYTFSGWSEIPEAMPAHDVTVTGSFTVNKYTITYIVDNEEYMTDEVDYGSTITPPSVPAREGYDFVWGEYPTTMPAYDITIYGTYATGIAGINNDVAECQYFTLDGQRTEYPHKGVFIVKMSDGTVKKVVVK